MSKTFKDLGKDSKDLLSQDFLSGSALTFIAQTHTPNQIGIKWSAKRNYKTDEKTKLQKEVVEILVEPKFEWKSQNIEFNGKLSTSRDYLVGFNAKDLLIKGTKFEFKTSNDKDGFSANFIPSYKNESLSLQTSFAYPFLTKKTNLPIKWLTEFVFQVHKKIYLGINFICNFGNQTKLTYEGVLVKHLNQDSAVAAKGSYDNHEESLKVSFSFFHKLSHLIKWSTDYEFDALRGQTAQVGGQYEVNNDTTLKGRAVVKSTEVGAPPDYRVGLSLKQKVSKNFKATLGADINVRHILGEAGGHAHSFGCEVEISDD